MGGRAAISCPQPLSICRQLFFRRAIFFHEGLSIFPFIRPSRQFLFFFPRPAQVDGYEKYAAANMSGVIGVFLAPLDLCRPGVIYTGQLLRSQRVAASKHSAGFVIRVFEIRTSHVIPARNGPLMLANSRDEPFGARHSKRVSSFDGCDRSLGSLVLGCSADSSMVLEHVRHHRCTRLRRGRAGFSSLFARWAVFVCGLVARRVPSVSFESLP